MCGITGIIAFTKNGELSLKKVRHAVNALSKRGPDSNGTYFKDNIALGHTRLSIIDTSENASQPLTDYTERYTIVFNGEFYNYKDYRKPLEEKGYVFKSQSDTEVLLSLYIDEGPVFLEKINGFFALAIYDKIEKTFFIARDRVGIKPLLLYKDEDKLIFSSEMKAILAYDIPKVIDNTSLFTYLQLNYIPAPNTIFRNVQKLLPGHYIFIKGNEILYKRYYTIPYDSEYNLKNNISYYDAQQQLSTFLEESVKMRLVSDVPLGAFLSGGIDSSIIVALASKHIKDLNTFSIGYKDEPYFDETQYAHLVAKRFNTNHTTFSLTNNDLFENLYNVLDYTDEPFADSSVLAVNILCKNVRKYMTVALSGDGADEMFAGYNKHLAEYKTLNNSLTGLVKFSNPLLKILPKSRNSFLSNKIRQLYRFSEGSNLSMKERYWKWASITDEKSAKYLLTLQYESNEYNFRKSEILKNIKQKDINDTLYTDMLLVLQNDMLTKVDLMSMANSLEVRTPYLDYNLIKFAFSLPSKYKINNSIKKRILQDSFKTILPSELYNRPKHGFEVPLLKWFRTDMKSTITDDLLKDDFIKEQEIFSTEAINKVKKQLFSYNPEDVQAQIWGLIVFQYWWKKWMN